MTAHRIPARPARALAAAVLTERCRMAYIGEDSYLALELTDLCTDARLRGVHFGRIEEAADDLVAAGVLVWASPTLLQWSDRAGLHREAEHKAGAR